MLKSNANNSIADLLFDSNIVDLTVVQGNTGQHLFPNEPHPLQLENTEKTLSENVVFMKDPSAQSEDSDRIITYVHIEC